MRPPARSHGFVDRILAHGIGGARDLPLPLGLTIAAAVVALLVSFTVLAVAWRTPRYAGGEDVDERAGRPAPAWLARLVDATWFVVLLRALGLLLFAYTVLAAVFGDDTLINPFFGIFYVLLWVGLIPLSVLVGPAWKAISPVRTIHWLISRATGGDPDRGLRDYPARLGLWPAALGLYAFVWLELVYPYATEQGPVRLWCAIYVAVMLVGGQVFGSRFFELADPFEVYSSLAAKISFWARHDGRLVLRSPLANLSTVQVRPGLVAVVCVLFGSTAFDSFRDSVHWIQVTQGDNVLTRVSIFFTNNLGLLGFCAAVAIVFALGTMATGVGPDQRRRDLPGQFAHSVVPIVVGYVLAHYLSYLVLIGQQTIVQMSDPLSTGANWFGTANLTINYYFAYHPTVLASAKVLFVVIGHVLGVIAAHDRAIRLLPRDHQVTGQLTLLATMVIFTGGGLYLLFSA